MAYLVCGECGSGKTVFMAEVSNRLRSRAEWVIVELNPEHDMLLSLAANLYSNQDLAELFQSASINLSRFGLEVQGSVPTAYTEIALERMLACLRQHGKKLLITVDEATNTRAMRVFVSTYQILIRKDLPVFLLMAGTHDSIRRIQDEKTLTFLYCASRIDLKPLNIDVIANNYRRNLNLDGDEALRMAEITKGYPLAFQVFGHFAWQSGYFDESTLDECKQYLDGYAYEKIWSELSASDKLIVRAIARAPTSKVSDVRQIAVMDTKQFNPCRRNLMRKGIVDGSTDGHVSFALPLFERFVLEHE